MDFAAPLRQLSREGQSYLDASWELQWEEEQIYELTVSERNIGLKSDAQNEVPRIAIG